MKPNRFATRAGGLLAAAALTFACGADDAAPPEPAAPAPRAASAPPKGTLEIDSRGGRVSITCQEVPRLAVLRRLADAAGFELEVRDLPRERLSLRIQDAPLLEVLSRLLRGIPYQVDYEVDPGTGDHQMVWLGAGRAKEISDADAAPEPISATGTAAIPERRRSRVSEESPEEREPELLRLLDDPDPSVRAEAVLDLPIEGDPEKRAERMERLAGLVQDPESMVRMAAIERLGEIESRDALDALLPALGDRNPEVVLEAISAIEDIDDPSAIPHLRPLLQDRDEEVREAADFAIDWLED